AVVDVREAPDEFDARLSARGKVYRYMIWNHLVRSPLFRRSTWPLRSTLDLDAMRGAAAVLVGQHDFRGFRASDCERRNTVRVARPSPYRRRLPAPAPSRAPPFPSGPAGSRPGSAPAAPRDPKGPGRRSRLARRW